MANTVEFAIDSRRSKIGGREVQASYKGIQREAVKTDRTTRKVQQGFDRLERSGRGLRSTLRSLFAGAGVVVATRAVVGYTDAYTQLQNRLRVVTTTQRQLTSSTAELFEIADDTRSGVKGTVELYSRLALATKELGTSQETLRGVTKGVNQAIAIGGSTAVESHAGMIQLAQGLASGALRGDELRSVLEQLPVVADVIGERLGATRGELRALGADGKITAQVVIEAFEDAADDLEERFGKTIPTIGSSLTVLQNNLIKEFGETDTSIGGTQAVAKGIRTIGENLDLVAAIAAGAGAKFALAFGRNRVEGIRNASREAANLRLRTLAVAEADQTAAQGLLRKAEIRQRTTTQLQQRNRLELVGVRTEGQRNVLLQKSARLEAELAERTKDVERARQGVLLAGQNVSSARNVAATGFLSAAGRGAKGLLAALGGVPGAILAVGTAAAVIQPRMRGWLDTLRGITKEQRNLIESSEALGDQVATIFGFRSLIDEAEDAEQRLRFLTRALNQLQQARDEAARLSSKGIEIVPVPDLIQTDPSAGQRLARTVLRGVLDGLRNDASAGEIANALDDLFVVPQAKVLRTVVSGDSVFDINDQSFVSKIQGLIDQAGGDASILPLEEILKLLGRLDNAPIDALVGALKQMTGRVKGARDETKKLVDETDRIKTGTGLFRFLNELQTAARNVGKSPEEIAVFEAGITARLKAGNTRRASIAEQEAKESVRTKFANETAKSINDEIRAINDEIAVLEAEGQAKQRLIATQIVENAARSAGREDIKGYVDEHQNLVSQISAGLIRLKELQDADQETKNRKRQKDVVRDRIQQLDEENAALLRTGGARRQLIEMQRLESALTRAGVEDLEEFKSKNKELIKVLQLRIRENEGLQQADQLSSQFAGSVVDPLRESLRSGDFKNIFRDIGASSASSFLDAFVASPIEEGMKALFQSIFSSLFGKDGIDVGGLISSAISTLISGAATAGGGPAAGPILGLVRGVPVKGVPSALGNVFGSRGIVRHRNGGIPGFSLPGLGDLPRVGSKSALFRMPGGGIGSIREGGIREAILNLENPGRQTGVRVVGTDIILGLARGNDGKLGVTLPTELDALLNPKRFRNGGVFGGPEPRIRTEPRLIDPPVIPLQAPPGDGGSARAASGFDRLTASIERSQRALDRATAKARRQESRNRPNSRRRAGDDSGGRRRWNGV